MPFYTCTFLVYLEKHTHTQTNLKDGSFQFWKLTKLHGKNLNEQEQEQFNNKDFEVFERVTLLLSKILLSNIGKLF